MICHVHTEGRAGRGCSPPALTDTDIPQQEPAAEQQKKGSQSAQLVLSSRAKVSRDVCHMESPRPVPTRGEVSGSSVPARGQWQRAALTPPRSRAPDTARPRHTATAAAPARRTEQQRDAFTEVT